MVRDFTEDHIIEFISFVLTAKEAQQIIEEVHESNYGRHMNAHRLSRKIMRQRNYWTTMEADYVPSMPSPWRSETYATYAITYHDITLAILYTGDKHYWEDSPNNI